MNTQSESIAKLALDIVAAQNELRNPVKDSVNPFFKSRYADLAAVRDAVVPVLAKFGLAVVQMPSVLDGAPALTSTLIHKSGEWMASTMLLNAVKSDPQGMGSAITYARRYALQAIAGVTAEDDDDGNAGSHPPRQQGGHATNELPAPKPPTTSELKVALQAKGWTWKAALSFVNDNEGASYNAETLPDKMKADHLARFYEWLRKQPDATKQPA